MLKRVRLFCTIRPRIPFQQMRLVLLWLLFVHRFTRRRSLGCMYGHTYSKSMDQPGKVTNLDHRVQLNRENEYSPVPVRA